MDIVGSLVMNRLDICLKWHAIEEMVSNLECLAQPESAATRFARNIAIRSKGASHPIGGSITEEMKQKLFRALSSLKSVQAVMCILCQQISLHTTNL